MRFPIRFLKFGIVGFANTVITWATYYALVQFFGVNYLFADILSFFAGLLNAWLWNRFWVFGDTVPDKAALPKFLTIYIGNLVFGVIFAYLLVDIIGLSELIVPPAKLCITVPVNFYLNKNWAFKK